MPLALGRIPGASRPSSLAHLASLRAVRDSVSEQKMMAGNRNDTRLTSGPHIPVNVYTCTQHTKLLVLLEKPESRAVVVQAFNPST